MEGYGDRLARGATSATFATSNGKISQKKWNEAFGDFSCPVVGCLKTVWHEHKISSQPVEKGD